MNNRTHEKGLTVPNPCSLSHYLRFSGINSKVWISRRWSKQPVQLCFSTGYSLWFLWTYFFPILLELLDKIFRKANISHPLIRTRTPAYQEVRNNKFSENFAYVLTGWSLNMSAKILYDVLSNYLKVTILHGIASFFSSGRLL